MIADTPLLLIVWHSRTGAAQALASACHEAAQMEFYKATVDLSRVACAGEVICKRCDEVDLSLLVKARGFVFICPENLGSMAGLMKEFFDRLYYPALEHLNGRSYAAMVSAGSDGQGAARQIERIAQGWRLRKIAEPYICNLGAQTPLQILGPKSPSSAQLQVASDLGQSFAAGLSLGVF